MRKRTETRLVDKMISAYVDWREACRVARPATSNDDPFGPVAA
jgi:hypothetical protein